MLTVDPERHEHHLHVDQLPVLPHATSDPVGTTSLERLVGDVPAFSAEVLVEDEVVDQTPDRLLRRVAKKLRRRRVPARHTLVGVHDDDGDRADLDERLEVLLLAADLGVALPRLLDSAHAGKGGADMLSDEREQFLVLLGVRELLRVGLDDERAHRPPPRGHERNAEPVLAHFAPELELALRNQLLLPLPGKPLRFARSEHVGGGPPRLPAAELDPRVGVRPVDVHLVVPVGPVDQFPFLVVKRNEEVVGVHEFADDGVHRSVKVLHVLGRAREVGDPVERRLHLLGAPTLGLRGLELGEANARLRELGREVDFRRHRSSSRQPGGPRRHAGAVGQSFIERRVTAPVSRERKGPSRQGRVDDGRKRVSRRCRSADHERLEDRNYLLRGDLSLPDGYVGSVRCAAVDEWRSCSSSI